MTTVAGKRQGAAERILESAYELLTQRRFRDVGINELIAHAGVTKATFYNHFRSKDELMLAVLALREQRATIEWLQHGSRVRGDTPEERLLAIFDLFDDWFRDVEFAGCPFINALLELGTDHPAGAASVQYLDNVRGLVCDYAEEAELRDPDEFARCFHMLMKGSIVTAAEGDLDAARPARAMAAQLIERHRLAAPVAG
jgi:AcrR family transcriptional regulator